MVTVISPAPDTYVSSPIASGELSLILIKISCNKIVIAKKPLIDGLTFFWAL
jgi:hypothetical protein